MGVFKIWEVVGGASKGGIVVKDAKPLGSNEKSERLGTGALVKELELDGERLQYKKLAGTGPETGWVSLKFKNTELVVKTEKEPPAKLWEVVGGGSQGGILVREGQFITSKEVPGRLSTGAIVKELDLEGERLQYELVSGSGPATGWVSTMLKKTMLLKPKDSPTAEEKPAIGTPEPLEILTLNEEKGFSYESYPSWVAWAAAVERLWREQKPFLPMPLEQKAQGSLKPMAPFKKFNAKTLKEATAKSLPGCMSGLDIPKSVEEMVSDRFGPAWLTRAFQSAGTLASDNQVTKIVECKELPTSGIDAAGGAAMKMFITVEYLTPDPELHTELFAKYPYLYEKYPGPRLECSAFNDIDGAEIKANLDLAKSFPFRTAKFYFGDISRETTDWILITERIPFGKRGKFEMGKCAEEVERKPYEIHPVCGKYQDWLLPNPAEFYCCIFRTLGRMAAWDKRGHYDYFFGPMLEYNEEGYLAATARSPAPKTIKEMIKNTALKMFDSGIDFLTNVAKTITPPAIQDKTMLSKMKEDIAELSPYFTDMGQYYQASNSKYLAALHANLQADNAFFWRDEYDNLSCGVLDFGALGRMPMIAAFIGVMVGADADIMMAHEEGILRSFVDEYHRCGAPQRLDLDDVRERFHLLYTTAMYDSLQWIERDVYKLTTKESFADFTGTLDPAFQGIFRVRCRTLTIINSFDYYSRRGDFKSICDKWIKGKGKRFLTQYTM